MIGFMQAPWWKTTTVYQVYPRSFSDANGDGIGDIPGIISKLDYIKDLGFETIWFSPFFRSPQKDFGYDISDFRDIAPEYGTLRDVERLIEEMHRRNMKILLDLVPNHTSDEHPWFVESRSSRTSPKRDWYVWKDGKRPGGRKPPNNWKSKVAGSGWHYDGATEQWYWAAFLPFQPDLNFRNTEVQEAILDIVRFWLDRGVDGFRIDILGSLFEDEHFRDNPFTWKFFPSASSPDKLFQSTAMTEHQPETFDYVKKIRSLIEKYTDPPRYLVGEVFGGYETLRRYCGETNLDGLQSVFLFQTMDTGFTAPSLYRLIEEVEKHFPEPLTPTWAFSNHDRSRRISVLKNDLQKTRLNTLLQFTLRGIPFTYYGEEIGMTQKDISFSEARDPIASMLAGYPGFVQRFAMKITRGVVNRDSCRTPMQWSEEVNAGFCPEGVNPWLPVNENHRSVNVEKERTDPASLFSMYRSLLHFRKNRPALSRGNLELIPPSRLPGNVLAYRRYLENSEPSDTDPVSSDVYVYLNLGNRHRTISIPAPGYRISFSTLYPYDPYAAEEHGGTETPFQEYSLKPWEGIFLERKE